ncbi:hypothetical protein D915_005899 [Fasciola hepatica]|uniref:Kinase D-interacting substrate of 220 kDa-like SAM domain-containing protein n=1 Tax=Fasciola hepatica TaxID=6192 RepID=A0A4E0R3W5_FASHE|nr:hypothetical protein D915_005899 [Fasciola hepatica]
MDMYSSVNPTTGQHPFHVQRPPYAGTIQSDADPTLRSPGDRLGEFQHNCLRSLASLIVCPHTALPITVGLFTQSGSMRETEYLQHLGEEISHMNVMANHSNSAQRTRFTFGSSLLPLIATFLIAYILGLTLGWQLGLAIAVTATVLYLILSAVVFFGLRGKNCPKSVQFAETLARYIGGCQLVLNILFYQAPIAPSSAKPVKLLPISLNLTGCVSGMEAVAQMTEKLWQFTEKKYGRLAVRLQWATKDNFSHSSQKFRKYCCLPLWLWLILSVLSTLSLATLMVLRKQHVHDGGHEVTSRPSSNVPKEVTTRAPDSHTVQEYLINMAIVCAVLSTFSSLALLAASLPSVFRLLQGRPFQRRKQISPYGDTGKLTEPPAEGCYGTDSARCDPISCMRFDIRENGRFDELHQQRLQQQQQFPLHLTSAATVAATAAVAAVTAADRQWRLIEQEKNSFRKERQKLRKSSGIKAVRQLFSPSKAVLQAIEDIESNSTEHSSQSRSSSNSCHDKRYRSGSQSRSDSADEMPGSVNPFFHDAVMFESGELLIRDQHHGKRQGSKKMKENHSSKQNVTRKNKRKSLEMQNLIKWKNIIRRGLMDACKVLSLIDSRLGDRQTRVVFCVNASCGLPASPASLIKLATFVRLIDRLAMQPPSGGTSNDVPVLFAPRELDTGKSMSQSKNLNPNASSTTWTPNIMVLLVAPVPNAFTGTGTQTDLHSSFRQQQQLHRDGQRSCTFSGITFPWTNFKLWWSVHHVCHLPIYLEEEPSGHRLFEPPKPQPATGSPAIPQPFFNAPGQKGSLFDLFLGSHELSDLNEKRLRQLITQISFMGRMINIERLQVERQGLVRIATPESGLLSGQAIMGALVTWLCLLQHWPFHAAWLAVFIEQQLRGRDTGEIIGSTGTNTPRRLARSGSSNLASGPDGDGINQLNWDSVLSQLHARILKRLAPAVEVARMKAMSVSLGASQPGPDFKTRPVTNYPPQVTSTLEICDLAMRDRDPRRLAEFLQSTILEQSGALEAFDLRGAFYGQMNNRLRAGAITVRQLLHVMRLTPLMNPQINHWIRDVLSSKMLASGSAPDTRSENDTERKISGGSAQMFKQQMASPRTARSSEEKLSRSTPTHSTDTLRVKMKRGIPSKKLSEMTVEDICQLIRSITDLSVNQPRKRIHEKRTVKSKHSRGPITLDRSTSSGDSDSPINDPVPPAPIDEKRKPSKALNIYEDRVRHLKVSGAVLSICPLGDLQKELNMSFGDWQLFSSLINYLKAKELTGPTLKTVEPSHTCGLWQGDQMRRSDPRLTRGASEQPAKWLPDQPLISTVSDTSIAMTVKSVPLTRRSRSPPQLLPTFSIKNTKSLGSLPAGSRTGMELVHRHAVPRQQHVFCPQHSRTAQTKSAKDPTAILCPRHQEQIKSFLSESQRDLKKTADLANLPQTDIQTRQTWDAMASEGLLRRHTCAEQTRVSAYGYPVSLQRSPPKGSSQAQFQGDRSSTLPDSFREYLPPGSANFIHKQYCAMHQKAKPTAWQHPSQPTWVSPGNSRKNAIGFDRALPEIVVPLHYSNGEAMSSSREATRPHSHRPLKTHPPSTERAAKETSVFDFGTPARERLSHLDHMPSGSGQVARADFCLPKDSESTSIAGELVEEVADYSPALMEQDSSTSHDPEVKEEDKVESSDHQSAHSCDCNYWYSLEAAAAAAAAATVDAGISTSLVKRPPDPRMLPCMNAYPGLSPDPEHSVSDSLSTTRSQLDVSSGSSSERSSSEASLNEPTDKLG